MEWGIAIPQFAYYIICENFVKFDSVTSELTELRPICERQVLHGQKTGAFSRISPDILDPFSQSFHHMKALYVQMMELYLIFQICQGTLASKYNVAKMLLTMTDATSIRCTSARKRIAISWSIAMRINSGGDGATLSNKKLC